MSDPTNFGVSKLRDEVKELKGMVAALQARVIYLERATKQAAPVMVCNQLSAVAEVVCEHYGVTEFLLKSEKRCPEVAIPRHVFCWLAYNHTHRSGAAIGRFLGGRDHTTIQHSKRRVKELMRDDPEFREYLDSLAAKVAEYLVFKEAA